MKKVLKKHKKFVIILLLFISIGFAYLSTQLDILGNTLLKANTWDVHFENVQVREGSVTSTDPVIDTNRTTVTFSALLDKPGDYYEFTVDAVNGGTIDAMIESFTDFNLTESQKKYLEISVTYEDGEEIKAKQQLLSGDTAVYKIQVSYKKDLSAEDLPEELEEATFTYTVTYVQRDNSAILKNSDRNLYNILNREVNRSGLVREYTNEHQDSFDASKSTERIYHWYANNKEESDIIKNKNNIIFGKNCWQITRTTDTGGIKLLYNGEPVDGKCMDTNRNHIGYNTYDSITLNNDIYYSDSYRFDNNTSKMYLLTNIKKYNSNLDDINSLKGKYTCNLTNADEGCSTLYLINDYDNEDKVYSFILKNDVPYYLIGQLPFNLSSNSLSDVGYMYNKRYEINYDKKVERYDIYNSNGLYHNNDYWYSESIEWNSSTNSYKLVNPVRIDSSINTKYKYTFASTDENYSYSSVYYVINSTYTNLFYFTLTNGHLLDYYNKRLTYGDSYTNNGDGTYTINNANTIELKDFPDNYTKFRNKIACFDSLNDTCSNIIYISSGNTYIEYSTPDNIGTFYSSFDYKDGQYVLGGSRVYSVWHNPLDDSSINLGYTHYWCSDYSDRCEKVNYSVYNSYPIIYYLTLENGNSGQDAINEMLFNNDVNNYDSIVKSGIDNWFKKNLTNYSSYLDDTIFCNSREIGSYKGWSSSNPNPTNNLLFSHSLNSKYLLSCKNTNDSFSVSNSYAKLTYPIGLPSYSEMYILGNKYMRKTNNDYWVSTPDYSDNSYSLKMFMFEVNYYYDNDYKSMSLDFAEGVRPMISIKSGVMIDSGDGSKENPYYIKTEFD